MSTRMHNSDTSRSSNTNVSTSKRGTYRRSTRWEASAQGEEGSAQGEEGSRGDIVVMLPPLGTPLSVRRLVQTVIKDWTERHSSQAASTAAATKDDEAMRIEAPVAGARRILQGEDDRLIGQEDNSVVRCTVDLIGKHYCIRTSGGEQVILDSCRGTLRLLLLVVNPDMNVPLANVFHLGRKKRPFIIEGKGGLCGTGLDKDGTVSLTYKPIIEDSYYIQKLKRDLKENLEAQDDPHASSNEAHLGELQAQEDDIRAKLKEYYDSARAADRIADSDQKGSTGKDIHALEVSVARTIGLIKADAELLGAHLRDRVKANGTIRYQKTNGWEWEFLFPLERVNLRAGDYRDSEHDQK